MHQTADLAALFVDDSMGRLDPFVGASARYHYGTEVSAFGYPEDTTNAGPRAIPRYFRGHIQRALHYQSHLGYVYDAVELSFGAPGGLSGGPVTARDQPGLAIALICENVESSTYISSILDVTDGDRRYTESIRNVIQYGIALRLDKHHEWLADVVPRLTGA